jgi:cytochrome b subunit of formate dehydrogenase
MQNASRIKRFNLADRLFHLFVMVTFTVQALTGVGRLLYITNWGKWFVGFFGGYESATIIHNRVGVIMIVGFIAHIVYVLARMDWRGFPQSLFSDDSLIPNLTDFKNLGQQFRWFFGMGPPARFGRWTYWEKFDYWAVFWGMPLFAVTGLMLMYPVATSRILPGWTLNVALLFHRAEAILAIGYLFIFHFLVGHFRRRTFPMNEAMFAGSVDVEHEGEEKPAWIERLKAEGKLEKLEAPPPASWFRVVYFIFGYTVVFLGIYLLIVLARYRNYIEWH